MKNASSMRSRLNSSGDMSARAALTSVKVVPQTRTAAMSRTWARVRLDMAQRAISVWHLLSRDYFLKTTRKVSALLLLLGRMLQERSNAAPESLATQTGRGNLKSLDLFSQGPMQHGKG